MYHATPFGQAHFSRIHNIVLICIVIMICISAFGVLAIQNNPDESAPGIILLTGFEPFGGLSVNSSWEAVRQIDGHLFNGRRVVVLRLPVTWAQAGHRIQSAIAYYHPELVISVGQGGNFIELDSHAQNLNASIKDNLGNLPANAVIVPAGTAQFTSAINLSVLSESLKHAGVSSIIADNSGNYLCNFVSYQSFAIAEKLDPDIPVLFVHVPIIHSLAHKEEQNALADITKALTIVIDSANRQTVEEG